MSVSEEDVQRWFDVVLQWGSAGTSEKCRDTFECLDELQVFLTQLENALEGMVCMNPCQPGAREIRGREGYGRREKKGREAGSLRWLEAGEKFQKAVKETNPTTFLDFHLTFSEA